VKGKHDPVVRAQTAIYGRTALALAGARMTTPQGVQFWAEIQERLISIYCADDPAFSAEWFRIQCGDVTAL
jgi:hypothetical protein